MYADKAIVYYSQKYPELGWAIFMAGGSLPNIPNISDSSFLSDALFMNPIEDVNINYYQLGNSDIGSVFYLSNNEKTGHIQVLNKRVIIKDSFIIDNSLSKERIIWFKRLDRP